MVTRGVEISKVRNQQVGLFNPPSAVRPPSIGTPSAPLLPPVPSKTSSPRPSEKKENLLWPGGPEASRMNQQSLNKQDFEPSPPTCNGLGDYIDIPAIADMRYNQEPSNITSLTLETPPQQPPVLRAFPAPLLNNNPAYSQDAGHYYPPNSQLFPATLGSTTSSTGMAHAPRTTAVPNPPGYNTREVYGGSRPSYVRTTDLSRPTSFVAPHRRHPISPTPSPNIGYTSPVSVRMDGVHQYAKSQATSVPPLMPVTTHGQLIYGDATAPGQGTPVKVDIHGTIDKGFFLSDNEWTCYRRNYFSCICSYSLSPHYPNVNMHYIPSGQTTTYPVIGFAMCISAVVSDSDSQTIDLVQHTPKRDKGPTAKPEKMRLLPKTNQPTPHSIGMYQDHHGLPGTSRSIYESGYNQSGQGFATEHTFERIQFKQATANNGKRRAAQQYYHLVVELYAEVGSHHPDGFIKVAERKSAKMIVRGRSPGHYQSDRRGSASSGPGGSSGMGSFSNAQVLGAEYGSTGSSTLLPGGYGGSFEHRGHYNTNRHHDLGMEPIIPSEEDKAINHTKNYQYYPGTIYESVDARQGIDMYSHRHETDNIMTSTTSEGDPSKVKHEYEHTLPSILYQPGPGYYARSCGRFEGKTSSAGYYPTPAPLSQSG